MLEISIHNHTNRLIIQNILNKKSIIFLCSSVFKLNQNKITKRLCNNEFIIIKNVN